MNSDTSVNNAGDAGQPAETPPDISLWSRLFNVLAAPGEVFDHVKASPPCTANWLVPTCFLILAGWLGVFAIFTQPAFQQQKDEAQTKFMQRLVEKGKMSQTQFEQSQQGAAAKSGKNQLLGAAAGVAIGSLASLCWGAFLIWLIGAKIHRSGFGFKRALEVTGLASMVTLLGLVVRLLLVFALGDIQASPTPALFIRDFDQFNLTHALLGMVDIFGLWLCAVRALGMAKLGNLSFALCLAWLLGIWAAVAGLILAVLWAVRTFLGF